MKIAPVIRLVPRYWLTLIARLNRFNRRGRRDLYETQMRALDYAKSLGGELPAVRPEIER